MRLLLMAHRSLPVPPLSSLTSATTSHRDVEWKRANSTDLWTNLAPSLDFVTYIRGHSWKYGGSSCVIAALAQASYTGAVTQAKTENGDAMNDPDNQPPRPADEMALLEALRRGDEQAFLALVTMHYAAMLRLAQMYVGSRAVAEEVIQETWIGVLQGLSRFEGRSSLKTWIFRILLNRARTRECIRRVDHQRAPGARYPGGWLTSPAEWDTLPEERLLSRETRQHVDAALTTLPAAQREVITLRDIDGWSAHEVCDYLGISEANQRVLLHRARSRVRHALADYLQN